MIRRALVLGGGGYAASAWEIGLITGMSQAGLDLRNADLIIGTSAGARVALHLASEIQLEDLFRREVGPNPRPAAPSAALDWPKLRKDIALAKESGGGASAILRRIGVLALNTSAANDPERRKAVAAQLPMQTWPERKLAIIAVNVETGERRVFDRNVGIDLVDAVLATSAFFGAPPVLFEGQHYIDGGFYSSNNADLAAGFDRVLILALRPPPTAVALVPVEAAVETLRAGGAHVELIQPDEDAQAALSSGGSPMNPAICEPAARAGRIQGYRLVGNRGSAIW